MKQVDLEQVVYATLKENVNTSIFFAWALNFYFEAQNIPTPLLGLCAAPVWVICMSTPPFPSMTCEYASNKYAMVV